MNDLKDEMGMILENIDHKNLDKDIAYFSETISTTENLIIYLWDQLKIIMKEPHLLHKMILHETPKISVVYYGS